MNSEITHTDTYIHTHRQRELEQWLLQINSNWQPWCFKVISELLPHMQCHSRNTNLDIPSYHPDSGASEGCQDEKKSESGRETGEERLANICKILPIFTFKPYLALQYWNWVPHICMHMRTGGQNTYSLAHQWGSFLHRKHTFLLLQLWNSPSLCLCLSICGRVSGWERKGKGG